MGRTRTSEPVDMGEWLTSLERLSAVPVDANAHLKALLQTLQERQILLDSVQTADISALPADVQARAKKQLRTLLDDTRVAEKALQSRHLELVKQQQRLATGRLTARGYRPDMPGTRRSLKRRA